MYKFVTNNAKWESYSHLNIDISIQVDLNEKKCYRLLFSILDMFVFESF